VEDKSEPIGRDILLECVTSLLKDKTLNTSIESVNSRVLIVVAFLAIGRAGEVGMSSYKLAHWNSVHHCLFLDWQESKTNAQKPMNFVPDAEHFEIDFYHSMACYFVCGAGSSSLTMQNCGDDSSWIFPFARQDASKKVSEVLKKSKIVNPAHLVRTIPNGWLIRILQLPRWSNTANVSFKRRIRSSGEVQLLSVVLVTVPLLCLEIGLRLTR